MRPNSLYNYRRYTGYVLPWMGGIKLKDLTRQHIERMFTGLEQGDSEQRPLSRHALRSTFTMLKSALEYWVEVEYIVKNPMARMKAPQPKTKHMRILSTEDVHAILEEAQHTRWYAPLLIMGCTGMRVSEVLGLEWKNIDLDRGTLRLEQQTGRTYGKPGLHLLPLKTDAAYRTIHVPPAVCDVLRWHQDRQRVERQRAQEEGTWEEHGVVFCGPQGQL